MPFKYSATGNELLFVVAVVIVVVVFVIIVVAVCYDSFHFLLEKQSARNFSLLRELHCGSNKGVQRLTARDLKAF